MNSEIYNMIKKVGPYLIVFVLFVLGAYYFLQNENPSIYSKSAGEQSVERSTGDFVPDQRTDYIFVTEHSESSFTISNIVIFLIIISIIFLVVRKIRSSRKY